MQKAEKIVIVMPTYNEVENLPIIVEEIFKLGIPHLNMLIVDDHSPDGTGILADQLSAAYDGHLQVLHKENKNGLGPAYIAGFKHALKHMDADILIQMDADFSHQPKYLPAMIEAIEGYDMVIGSRYTKGGSVDHSWGWLRKLLSGFANGVYVPSILGIPVKDATGGFRLWRKETLIGMDIDRIKANGYVFQVELTYLCYKTGYKIREIPIHFPDRIRGDSKMSSKIASEAAVRTWQILFRHRHLKATDRRNKPYE